MEEQGKRSMSLTKTMQSPGETFTDFLHRLTYAVNSSISDAGARQVLIETFACKNPNTVYKTFLDL